MNGLNKANELGAAESLRDIDGKACSPHKHERAEQSDASVHAPTVDNTLFPGQCYILSGLLLSSSSWGLNSAMPASLHSKGRNESK